MPSPRTEPRLNNSSMSLRCMDAGLSTTMRQCTCQQQTQAQVMAEIHEVCIGNDEQSDCGIDRETRKLIKDLNCRVALLEEQQVVLPDMLGDEHRLAEVEERLTALESKSQSATVVSHHASAETLWTLSRAEIRLAELETLDAGTRLAAVEAALTASPL
eukprot:CAMPEP_0172893974 /NCGR_PEP_ID=MMETSP1075-20121228/149862_1 /TAXON_ID=2916 /ORGANISM="Ceratium fusus, Strain PA161109" /LENGTH=158 /DNA_ID=CAMNT_0013748925 /DNA_START=47 /DNA_END=519 /DNA_ORIENTATION=-